MPFVVAREGAVQVLGELLASGEDWQLGLYNSAFTPTEADTASTYTSREAAFSGYSRKTLARGVGAGKWSAPALAAPSGSPAWTGRGQVARSSYAGQSWTVGATGDAVHGYFVLGATSGKLILAGSVDTPRTVASGDVLSVTPVVEM